QVSAAISDLVASDAPLASGHWQGIYLTQGGSPVAGGPALPAATGNAPAGACGVSVQVKPTWTPFLMQLAGFKTLSATAKAGAVVGNNPNDAPANRSAGIVALATSGNHTIYGGGSGQFVVNGDILDESTGNPGPDGYADTVDNFQNSATIIHGQMQSVAAEPLDPCFYPAGPTQATCSKHTSEYIQYDGGILGGLPVAPDPLTYLATPPSSAASCPPGGSPTVYATSPSSGTLQPGVYKSQVTLTGSATFADCGGQPGLYIFQGGLAICPRSGATVTSSDVTLFSSATVKLSACGSGKASNADGIHLGGQGTINLTGPNGGAYAHMLLFQSRAVPANIGLDDQTGDTATISLKGAIYDNSQGGAGILASGGLPGPGGGSGGGTIAIDGIVVVDQFSTGGTANVTITYDATQIPGVGPVLVQ
ncbi:MAG TPA: hypothetical protein VNM16_03380, partial [Bacillota bacterium]|nr:hypothetical protein [Bacillota bacterium]